MPHLPASNATLALKEAKPWPTPKTVEGSEAEGFQPEPEDYQPPPMNPAPIPETAQLDPWMFLDDLTPIDVDAEYGAAILALHTAQLTWGLRVLKERIEDMDHPWWMVWRWRWR